MIITKRNGDKQEFNFDKIDKAVRAAFNSLDRHYSDEESDISLVLRVIKDSIRTLCGDGCSTVEDIQDIVEKALMSCGHYDVAKSYILYREKHREARFIKERIDYMNKYSQSTENAATSSETDANSNVTMKNVANLEGEVYKSTNRIIQRSRMKEKLQEMFPEVADQYEVDLNNHIIYVHDEASSPTCKFYCMAATLYPLMTDGTGKIDGITPSPPNDIQSFSGQVTNLVFLLSSQAKGAVALGDYFIALNYYVIKEFGEDWYNHIDDVITSNVVKNKRTIKDAIRKGMKQFIYGVNQPAGNRSYNSPFSNISYYDSVYFKSLFEDFYYPDCTQPKWEAIDVLQRIFIELHRELRLIKPLTFPVTTMAMVHDGNDYIDQEYKQLCADEWAKGSSFFLYSSDNPSGLSSCCFSSSTKVLWKNSFDGVKCTTLKELYDLKWEPYKKNLKIYHNGSWVKGKAIKLPPREMYKVITSNNKEFIMTDNHINITYNGEITTDKLTTNDYLMFNTRSLEAITENNQNLTYEQGLLVGLFIGDGTFGNYVCQDGSVHNFQLSLNEEKWNKVKDPLSKLGDFKLGTIYNNVYPIKCYSKELTTFISEWTTNEPNKTTSLNKNLNINCIVQNREFRQGILDGWYITDGGNSNRCYSISKDLIDNMEILCTSLGKQCIINVSDRTDEDVIIRGVSYNRNYPLYCLRWYDSTNNRQVPQSGFKWKNNSIYWKIKSIEQIDYNEDVYCIQCNNVDEPYFTLPSGLITHNCRVLNEIQENTFSSTIGMTGVMTGSANVITINLNRIVQDWANSSSDEYNDIHTFYSPNGFRPYLENILERIYKYHIAYKTLLYELEDNKMFSSSNADYIYLKKLYSTIGIIGYTEAAEFLELKVDNNDEYKKFLQFVFSTIKENNKSHSIKDKKKPFQFNSEAIPGEALAIKLYNWDKEDGYKVPLDQNLYSSYFFKQWDKDISVLDKLRLHGSYINKSCDGGQACHIHLDSHLSKEQYLKIMDFAIKEGVNYYTFNIPMSECLNCGHVVNAPITECPICKSKEIDYWLRIIGYIRPLSAYSDDRRKEAQKRVFSNLKQI